MPPKQAAATLALVLAAAGLGWLAHTPGVPATDEPDAWLATPDLPPASARPAPAPLADARPAIVVASDGNVTLHVDQQPLAWVLEQIAQQSGRRDVVEGAHGATALLVTAAPPVEAACGDEAVQQEARRRLDELADGDRVATVNQQPSVQH